MKQSEISKIIQESIRLKSDRDTCLKEFDNFFLRTLLWLENNFGQQSIEYEKAKKFQSELCFEAPRVSDLTKFGLYQKTIDGLIAIVESSSLRFRKMEESDLEYLNPEQIVQEICCKFSYFVDKINSPYRQDRQCSVNIRDEYDVQHILRAILVMFFRDIREEYSIPEQLGASSRIDFFIPSCGIAIEVKKTRRNLTDCELGQQIAIDVARYLKCQQVKRLVFFIYDPDSLIKNPVGLLEDANSMDERVVAITSPKRI